ncbi:phosphatidylinositol phosphatase PTPRQ-like [Montipora foliosa]|uniref:phosphatidylinositol phosphatase PTPRQ-like n=1 Tax=Montipora foliosa TaxID=591990 RepID=UPI0035F1A69C
MTNVKALFLFLVHQALYASVVWSQNCDATGNKCNCSSGWVQLRKSCYIFSDKEVTRFEAQNECANYAGSFAMPKVQSINNFLADQMTTPTAWIGLSDKENEGSFIWRDGNALGSFTQWKEGHPLDSGSTSDTDHVQIEKSTGKWCNVEGSNAGGNICTKKVSQKTQEDCAKSALGMEYTRIPDSDINASSELSSSPATHARLGHPSGWCSGSNISVNSYLQVNLSNAYVICAIATQGHFNSSFGFVDEYRLQFSEDGREWTFYQTKAGLQNISSGNRNHYQVKKFFLECEVTARVLRIWPVSSQGLPCLRLEIYGKEVGPPGPLEYLKVFNTSYNYVKILWKPPSFLFNGPMSGYFIKLEKKGSPRLWSRHIYSSCHNEGINVTSLEEHQSYCIYVAAFNKYGQGNASSCIAAVTGEKVRVKFKAQNQSTTSIKVTWKTNLPYFLTLHSEGSRGFIIDYYKAENGELKANSVFLCNTTSSYVFSNLSIFTNYCFNVIAFDSAGIDTNMQNTKCTFTEEIAPQGPPLNITAKNSSSTSLLITWKPIAKNLQFGFILGYRITYKKEHVDVARRKRRSANNPVEVKEEFTWNLEGLEKFTNYCIQMEGFNSKGSGNLSDWLCAFTDEDVPSVAPIIATGYNTSTSSLFVKWHSIPKTPNATHGHLLGYMMNLTTIKEPQNTVLFETEISELSKEVTGLSAYTNYCVSVAGRTRIGPGKWSDCYFITTEDAAPTSPPIELTAISLTSPHTMNVTWGQPLELNGEASGYKIEFEKQLDNGRWEGMKRQVIVCSPPVTLPGLDINSRYRVRVTAGTRRGFGPFSKYAEGDTCSCPETLQISGKPSSLDDAYGKLSNIIESLVADVCGICYAFNKTRFVPATKDAQIDFPVVTSHGFASTESAFVPVIQVPGLAVVQRKTEPELGAMEKVMAYSVFGSWPIMAISTVLTILAGLLIWALDTSANAEEFPSRFCKGFGNGLWWAFITMTTLGYGDRTPKSDRAKAFAIVWFLVGLVVFGLFSAGLSSDLTVVVSQGGPGNAGTSSGKVLNIATLENSTEKDVAVRKLMDQFKLSAEYSTIEELVAMLKNGTVNAILLDMYTPVRRLDLFNGSWFEITQIVEKEISHGIVLNGAGAMALVKDLQEMIRDKNVQTNFLTHKDEEDEEHEHIEAHEVRALNPASRRPVSRAKNAKRHCEDEADMKKLVEEFHQDFCCAYERLRKKVLLMISLKKSLQKGNKWHLLEKHMITKDVNNIYDEAKLW